MDITFESASGTAEFSDLEMEETLNIENLEVSDLARIRASITERTFHYGKVVLQVEVEPDDLAPDEDKAAELIEEEIEGLGATSDIVGLRASYDGSNVFSFETIS
jgi:hypothetical protein